MLSLMKKFLCNASTSLKIIRGNQFRSINTNYARLVGTIATDITKMTKYESQLFYLRTYNADKSYQMHRIIVSSKTLGNLAGTLEKGQRLLLTGKLRMQSFLNQNGKKRDEIQIKGHSIYLCDDFKDEIIDKPEDNSSEVEEESKKPIRLPTVEMMDQNYVRLFGMIPFDVKNTDSFSQLSIAHRFICKFENGVEEEKTDFLPVFVYEDNLREMACNQFKRTDRIYVEGRLKYKPTEDNRGRRRYTGYIEASRLTKLISLKRSNNLLNVEVSQNK